MARINVNDVDAYVSSGSGEFFQLENDGDSANVHFLIDGADDLDIYVVHKVRDEKTGRDRYVSCLRMAGDPIDVCPLCEAGIKKEVRLFLQMYDADTQTLKVWDRGKTFISLIQGYAQRIIPLYKRCIEVVRKGKKGDTKTQYNLFPIENDENYPELELEDLPEKTEIMGETKGIILDRSYDQLIDYLNSGILVSEDDDDQADVKPRANRGATSRQPVRQREDKPQETTTRFTPRATGRKRSY